MLAVPGRDLTGCCPGCPRLDAEFGPLGPRLCRSSEGLPHMHSHDVVCVRSSFLAAADGDYEAPREQRASPELLQQFPLE